jgi:hypothetical protein
MRRSTSGMRRTRRPRTREDVEPVAAVRARLREVRTKQQAAHLVAAYERMARDNVRFTDPRKRHSIELGELFALCYFAAEKVRDDALIGRLFRATVPMIWKNAFFFDRPKGETKYQKFKRHVKRCRRQYRPSTWNLRLCVLAAFGWLMSCRWSDFNGTRP